MSDRNSKYNTTPQTKKTLDSLWRLEKIILDTLDFKEVVQKIVDSVLLELGYLELGYRIVVLALTDSEGKFLKRISISKTEEAEVALKETPIPFHDIDIPLTAKNNICIKVLESKTPGATSFWPDILCPPYTIEDAIKIQKVVGINTSLIYPVMTKENAVGIMIFSMKKQLTDVSDDEQDLIRGYTDVVGLAVQNAKLYTKLEDTTDKLRIANEKLKALDKLKDEFLSIASHELRTPMTAIKSYLWMVLNRNADSLTSRNREYLDRVYNSTERLINLVNDMLNVSRIESGKIMLKLEDFDLIKLVDDVKNEVNARMSERNQNLVIKSDEQKLVVNADREKMHQVLENLIGNSIKFTPDEGKITVGASKKDGHAEIYVADTGKGIAKEDFPKLFKKFGRLENTLESISQTSGTGLGLYICQQFVELCGGKIRAESNPGEGAKFIFTLPLLTGKTGKNMPVLTDLKSQ